MTDAPRPPESLQALELALAAARREAALEAPAREVLTGNAELLRSQAALAREQIGLARNERFRARIKAVRDGALALLALAALVGVGLFVWTARQASGLVITPFSVPPALEQDGLTGAALASQLLDRLSTLQAQTDSARAADTYENDWEGDVSVEIPSTGVSVGEMNRWLRAALGHETRITGEVMRRGSAWAMSVRAGGLGGRTLVQPDGELDELLQGAAESIYEQTQPLRYGVYLRGQGREAEATRVFTRLAAEGDSLDRAWAYLALGVGRSNLGDFQAGNAMTRRALELQPDLALANGNIAGNERDLGRDEASLRTGLAALRAWEGAGARYFDTNAAAVNERAQAVAIADLQGDHAGAVRILSRAGDLREYAGNLAQGELVHAEQLARLHDAEGAHRALAALSGGALRLRRATQVDTITPTVALTHIDAGRWPQAAAELEALSREAEARPATRAARAARIWPLLALAWANSGRMADAEVLIAPTAADCAPCLIARGQLAALRGEHGAADRWFAEAARQTPSLPQARSAWGEAKLARGDLDGAIALFREAQARGPRWADPLKFEGDALARQGKHREALSRYEAALERAPRWGAAHLAAGRSLEALGRSGPAQARYAQAARLDLSAADRAAVQRLLRSSS